MPRPYPDSAKRENFCGGWDFQKPQVRREGFYSIWNGEPLSYVERVGTSGARPFTEL